MPENIPYHLIAEALRSGDVVPFLGAGASAAHRAKGQFWEPGRSFCPRGDELAKHLARIGNFPDKLGRDDLMLVATYFEAVPGDRTDLHRKLEEIFSSDGLVSGPIHHLLAGCPNVPLIITTNYDNLIELAFNGTIHVVVDHGDEQWVDVRLNKERSFTRRVKDDLRDIFDESPGPIVFKMHGSVYKSDVQVHQAKTWRRFVLTADDYVGLLAKENSIPTYFGALIKTRRFLFLGYGLKDWNVRVLLSRFRNDKRSWAIQYNPLEAERKIWERQGVNLYHCELPAFVEALKDELGK